MVADNRKVEDSEAKALKDKLKEEHKAGDLLFSVLGIHVLAGREEPTHLPNFVFVFYIKTRARLANIESSCWLQFRQYRQSPDPNP